MRRTTDKIRRFYDARGVLCWGLLALVLALAVLFAGKNIGLSNNGDFQRVMNASSLTFAGDEKAFTYNGRYKIELGDKSAAGNVAQILFGGEGFKKYPSLQVAFTRISVVANLVLNKLTGSDMTVYRLEVLGAMYALLYAAALMFLMAQFRLEKRLFDGIAKAAVLLVLCDVGYLTYFNSFYGEALQLIAFVFLAAMLVRVLSGKAGMAEAVLSALGCVVFGWSKFFNIPAACLFAVLLEGLILYKSAKAAPLAPGGAPGGTEEAPRPASRLPRVVTVAAATAAGIAAVAILAGVYLSVPDWIGTQTKFNAVFFGALRGTDGATAEKYLDELDLPPELAVYRAQNIYVDGVALELEQKGLDTVVGGVSDFRLGAFYLRHPDILAKALDISLQNARSIRPAYLGNFDDTAPKLTLSHRFSVWSDVRTALGFDSWAGFAGVVLAFGLTLFLTLRRRGYKWYVPVLVLAALAGALAYFFAGPFISNGEGDLAKHLFAFCQAIDLMFLFTLIAALNELSRRKLGLVPAAGAVMALCLLLSPVSAEIADIAALSRAHGGLEAGAYAELGSYNNGRLKWRVLASDGGVLTLMSADNIGSVMFSPADSGAWETSTLRSWLNKDFLEGFTAEERSLIIPTGHNVLLSRETKSEATSGNSDFYFSQVPSLAARGYAEAYQKACTDDVMIPDIALVSSLAQSGKTVAVGGAYWLDTPYFNNGFMTRVVMPDGSVLMREATDDAGIRPVLRIEGANIKKGSGSFDDPFILDSPVD
jgi:hypothetical protein